MDTWKTQLKQSTMIANCTTTPTQSDEKISHCPEEKLIEDFSSYTTLHGFHFLLDSGSLWRRLLWTVLILIGFTSLCTQIWWSITRLNAHELVISKSVEVNESLPFPAVTICNQNFMKKSKIMGTVAQDYLDQMDFVKFQFAGQKHKDVPSFDVGKKLQEAGHRIEDMIQECEFAGVSCHSSKDFVPTIPSFMHGLCYTFTANSSASKKVGKGKRQGLKLRLNAEFKEYYGPYSYDATGFKIVVQEPDTFHAIDDEGYDISPGFFTSIRIKRKKTISKPPPFRSECGSKKLLNFERYTQKSCFHECLSQTVAVKCKCRLLGMVEKGINITRYCNNTEITQCFQKINTSKITPKACGCPLECESIEYNIQTSTAYYPSQHLWDSLVPLMAAFIGLNASDPKQKTQIQDYVRKDFAYVNIFFENMLTDVTEENERYGISNFGTDIGGNMGLFLGCSMLTICEFIDLIVMVFLNRWRKRKAKIHVKTQSHQNPIGDVKTVNW